MIAALFVERFGTYSGLDDVDCWHEARDARCYGGPWPVVAHPPCARWCALAKLNESLHGYMVGDDGDCFASALGAVRRWGGILEHPAGSLAWDHFDLPKPMRGCWSSSLFDSGVTTEISQVVYGHRARKRTWLYYVGDGELPALDWTDAHGDLYVSDAGYKSRVHGARMYQKEALSTPPEFRDVLLRIASGASSNARASLDRTMLAL